MNVIRFWNFRGVLRYIEPARVVNTPWITLRPPYSGLAAIEPTLRYFVPLVFLIDPYLTVSFDTPHENQFPIHNSACNCMTSARLCSLA